MEQKSIFKSSIWRVFEVFSEEPLKIHFIKEISRKINLAPTSVKKYVEELKNQEIIAVKKGERFKGYISDRENSDFIFYKKILNLIKLKDSGIIDFIENNIHPVSIVLYGSYFRGEDVEGSDIDILVITKTRKEMNLDNFEKKLKRKIHTLFEDNFKNLNKNLQLEIMNGEVLRGYLKDG